MLSFAVKVMVDVEVVARPRVWRQEVVARSWVWRQEVVARSWLEDVEEEEEEVQAPLQKQASVVS